jgi:hypothetical protein
MILRTFDFTGLTKTQVLNIAKYHEQQAKKTKNKFLLEEKRDVPPWAQEEIEDRLELASIIRRKAHRGEVH